MDESVIKSLEAKGFIQIRPGEWIHRSDRRLRTGGAVVQEREEGNPGPGNRKDANANRKVRGKKKSLDRTPYRVGLVLRFADKRQHDPDGCLSTILDCLVAARRRLEDFAETIDR